MQLGGDSGRKDGELWLFTKNTTAESCFFKGGYSSKLLHDLVLRLRQAELKFGFVLHMVHVAGMQMIAQGMDYLSQGLFIEGVMSDADMLSYVNLSLMAWQRHRPVLDFIQSWLGPTIGEGRLLTEQE
jgi:hypothetical protein